MRTKIKALILLIVFSAILYLPFSLHLANGNIFDGLPIPLLNSSGKAEENNAAMDAYAASLPKPALSGIDLNYMRNHMNILKQEGHSTQECAKCHTNRAQFCDRCHNFVGISPQIDY